MATERTIQRRRRRGPQEGVSFIEVMVTTLVIGLLAAVVIPSFLGVRDEAGEATASSLIRTAASAVESASVDAGYEAVDAPALEQIEPSIEWLEATGAVAKDDQVSITRLGPAGFTLSAEADDGTVYTYVKDALASPTVSRTCGSGCSW
jgi:type IV pilus assembly protein PilA